MNTKEQLRQNKLLERNEINTEDKEYLDHRICHRLFQQSFLEKANTVFVYCSYKSEASTYEIIARLFEQGKKVAAPRVAGNKMDFYLIDSFDCLEKGYMGISEPKAECAICYPDVNDVILVPGVVFDRRLFRIGYGGGFYDKYLSENKRAYSVGIAYEFQVIDEIPIDSWDRGLDLIITDKNIIKI